jgi:hypothetical protein
MAAEIVTAVYRVKPGQDARMRELLARHIVALRGSGLITARPRVVLAAQGGFYVEVFEWKDGQASAHAAHVHPDVGGVWKAMEQACDFSCLAELRESTAPFPHFTALDDLGS